MPGMRRGDRKSSSDDNASRNLPSPQEKPPIKFSDQLAAANSKRIQAEGELEKIKSELGDKDKKLAELVHVQQNFQALQNEIATWKERTDQNHQLYVAEQQKYQETLVLYNQERATSNDWLAKFEAAEAQRNEYLALYNEAQTQLKYERRSKAGIKGWETRRKQENQKLKQEIGELTVSVRESLSRKEEALENLSLFADRMDKIQGLVNSIEGESSDNPIGLLQKFKRIWISIKDILSE